MIRTEILTETGVGGRTNVRSARFGSGASNRIADSLGRFLVCTMPVPWGHAAPRLAGVPTAVVMVESVDINTLDRLEANAAQVDCVVGVGGGQAIDTAKYIAWKRGIRLVTIPTVISVDAFVTPAAAIRRRHRIEYVGKVSPDPLVIDYDLLRTAPAMLNAAGAGDLLSIHTACFDWELAAGEGRDAHSFDKNDIEAARQVLASVEANADEIAVASDKGLQAMVDGYLRVNAISLPAGHYRVEEGSEHFLFYELEERLRRPFIHGNIIGLGIAIMSRLQQNHPEYITRLMDRIGLNYQPQGLGLTREDLRASLLDLAGFVEASGYWYTIINHRHMTQEWVDAVLNEFVF
jgi:glycerol-1-phosphate dehydrogenase [NAD(P)+]